MAAASHWLSCGAAAELGLSLGWETVFLLRAEKAGAVGGCPACRTDGAGGPLCGGFPRWLSQGFEVQTA